MARVQIQFPEKNIFQCIIPVRITDLNYGNHLANDKVLTYLHEARVQMLGHFNYTELNIEGAGIIMADAAIQYKSEAFYGDVLTIELAIADFTRSGFDILYRISTQEKLIALAKTGIVFFDYSKRKILPVPERFLEKVAGGI